MAANQAVAVAAAAGSKLIAFGKKKDCAPTNSPARTVSRESFAWLACNGLAMKVRLYFR